MPGIGLGPLREGESQTGPPEREEFLKVTSVTWSHADILALSL